MLLITSLLLLQTKPVPKSQGELKVLAKATMLMKTKDRQPADLIKATISMKINNL
jgi:hypothetical protein